MAILVQWAVLMVITLIEIKLISQIKTEAMFKDVISRFTISFQSVNGHFKRGCRKSLFCNYNNQTLQDFQCHAIQIVKSNTVYSIVCCDSNLIHPVLSQT